MRGRNITVRRPASWPSRCAIGRDRCQASCGTMPVAIATTKTMTPGDNVARLSSAGPGDRPTRPHPIPNSAAPATSGRSIPVLPGRNIAPANHGRALRSASMKPGTDTASAAAITTARLGSQAPKMSRKPRTLVGCTMPEIKRPAPKIRPQNKGAMIHMAQPPST